MNKPPFEAQARKLERLIKRLPRQIGIVILRQTKLNFRRQAFFEKKWPKRKSKSPRNQGGNLLIDTGILRNSLRSEVRGKTVTIFSDVPYATVHNQGGTVRKRTSRKPGYKSRRKGGPTYTMPKRQFLGTHPKQQEAINKMISKRIQKVFK